MAVLMLPCAALSQRTVSLDELYSLADEHSASVKISRATIQSAKHDVAASKADRLPDIGSELSIGYLADGVLSDRSFSNWKHVDNPHFTNNFALRAQQVIYSGGALTTGIDIAKIGEEMAELNYVANREQVRFIIASHYLDMCRLQNQSSVLDVNIALTKKIIDNIKVRFENGTALKTDITRYELQLESLSLRKTEVENAHKVICHHLATMLHMEGDTLLLADFKSVSATQTPRSEPEWQELAAQNSIVKQSMLGISLSEKKLKMEKSAMLPKVAAVAELHFDGPITNEVPVINNNIAYWFAGVGVSYNLSSLYKNNRKIDRAKADLLTSRERLNLAMEDISNSVHSTYTDFLTAHKQLTTQRKSVELAKENFDVVEKRYDNGLAILTDMLDASNTKLSAEIGEVDAEINILFQYYKLKYLSHTL